MQLVEGDDDTLLLGLRVYTKSDAKVNISGQLRHGRLISWKARKEDSDGKFLQSIRPLSA